MKYFFFVITFFVVTVFGQKLDPSNPPTLTTGIRDLTNKLIIICHFENAPTEDKINLIKNPENWIVRDKNDKNYKIAGIKNSPKDIKVFSLAGEWTEENDYTIEYLGEGTQSFLVVPDSSIKNSKIGVGDGKSLKLAARRIATSELLFAIDYATDINILSLRYAPTLNSNLVLKDLNLQVKSNGTLVNKDVINNGTQTSINIAAVPYLFAGGLIYRNEFHLGYQIDTKMNSAQGKYFDVVNKSLNVGVELELPYSNYPMFVLHRLTKYS